MLSIKILLGLALGIAYIAIIYLVVTFWKGMDDS